MNKLFILFATIAALTACNCNHETLEKPVKYKSLQDIDFTYQIVDTLFGRSEFHYLKGTIINNRKDTVYYLTTSCNGLDYSFIGNKNRVPVEIMMHCNVSWRMIGRIAPSEKLPVGVFLSKKNDRNTQIGIDFRITDKYIPFETVKERNHQEWLRRIGHQETDTSKVLWGREI